MTFRPLRNRDFEIEPDRIRIIYENTFGTHKYDDDADRRYGCGRWFPDIPGRQARLIRWADEAMGEHSGLIWVEHQKTL